MQPARRRGVVSLPAHRRRDGAGARGICARTVARAGRSGTARRTGLAGALKGRHRQLVDAYAINKGAPLAFAHTFLATSEPPTANVVAATAVVVLRHDAFPLALGDEMWRKY